MDFSKSQGQRSRTCHRCQTWTWDVVSRLQKLFTHQRSGPGNQRPETGLNLKAGTNPGDHSLPFLLCIDCRSPLFLTLFLPGTELRHYPGDLSLNHSEDVLRKYIGQDMLNIWSTQLPWTVLEKCCVWMNCVFFFSISVCFQERYPLIYSIFMRKMRTTHVLWGPRFELYSEISVRNFHKRNNL